MAEPALQPLVGTTVSRWTLRHATAAMAKVCSPHGLFVAERRRPPVPAKIVRLPLCGPRSSPSRPSVPPVLLKLDSHAQQKTIGATMTGASTTAVTMTAVTMDVIGELASWSLNPD